MYTYQTIFFDFTLDPALKLPLVGKLWGVDATPRTAMLMETVTQQAGPLSSSTRQAGAFSFSRDPSSLTRPSGPHSQVGLTIEGAGNPSGALFWSGPMDTLPVGAPADPSGLIEIVVFDVITVSSTAIIQSLPSAPFTHPFDKGITINSLALAFNVGSMTLVVQGDYKDMFGSTIPVTEVYPFELHPWLSPSYHAYTSTFEVRGLWSGTKASRDKDRAMCEWIRDIFYKVAWDAVRREAPKLGMSQKVVGSLSAHDVVITPSGIDIRLSVGEFGGVCSTYTDLVFSAGFTKLNSGTFFSLDLGTDTDQNNADIWYGLSIEPASRGSAGSAGRGAIPIGVGHAHAGGTLYESAAWCNDL